MHRGSSKRNSDVEVHHGRGLLALSPAALVRPWFSPATGLETRSPAEIGHFIGIYVKCALDVYIDREVNGLYAKALRGESAVFPGVADPYEVPLAPEVIVETARESPEESLTKILQRRLLTELFRLPRLDVSSEVASDIVNIGSGALSPLEGFMGLDDLHATLFAKRLTSGVPWTIPIVLDISRQHTNQLGEAVGLWHDGRPLALLEGPRAYSYDRQELAKQVFGTESPKHPGMANVLRLQEFLLRGNLHVFGDIAPPWCVIASPHWRHASCSRQKAGAWL